MFFGMKWISLSVGNVSISTLNQSWEGQSLRHWNDDLADPPKSVPDYNHIGHIWRARKLRGISRVHVSLLLIGLGCDLIWEFGNLIDYSSNLMEYFYSES